MKRYATIVTAVLAMVAMMSLVTARAGAPASASTASRPIFEQGDPRFVPGAARSVAYMGKAQVETIAIHEFGPGVLQHPFTVTYGSFTDNRYERGAPGGLHAVGTIDAWEVTVTGLSVPRPCPRSLAACPTIQTLTIVVDDKASTFVEAIGA